ncbi:MAG: hypothetical protein KF678_03495 [Phycisphaeraceae bacterium]|nr:hypothetical protein [Phycisphaeraceae bacterium]
MAIIATSNYKAYAGITVSTWDTLLNTLITAAQAKVERYCNRVFDTATFTEYYSGDDAGCLILKNTPITSVTSVSYVAPDGNNYALPTNAYRFDPETGELFLIPRGLKKATASNSLGVPYISNWQRPSFSEGFRNYVVVYVGGYGGTYVMPTDLQLAMYQYVDELFVPVKNGAAVDTSMQNETLGDYSYTRKLDSEVNSTFATRFGPFRRMVP